MAGCFIECVGTEGAMPVEDARVEFSELLATGGTSSNTVRGSSLYITCTSDEDGYIAFGPTPNSAANPRHRLKAGIARSFSVANNDKAHYTAG